MLYTVAVAFLTSVTRMRVGNAHDPVVVIVVGTVTVVEASCLRVVGASEVTVE